MPRGIYKRKPSKVAKLKGAKSTRLKGSKANTVGKVKPKKRMIYEVAQEQDPPAAPLPDDSLRDHLREWIDAAPTLANRQQRKAAMLGVMYGAGQPTFENASMPFGVTDELVKDSLKAGNAKPRTWIGDTAPTPGGIQYTSEFNKVDGNRVIGESNPKTLTGNRKVPVLSVVPPTSIIAQATAMRYGAFFAPKIDGTKGYGPYNWRDQPIEAHIYIDAALRHLMQWWDGDEVEIIRDDTGGILDEVSHLAFALATIGILIDARANGTMKDDRPRITNRAASGMLHDHKLPSYDK